VFTDVQRLPIHGGSLRVTAAREADPVGRARVDALLEREKSRGAHRPEFYADFGLRVRTLGQELVDTLRRLWAGGAKIVAYGASAKGSTLLNVFHIGGDLVEYVVDRSRAKQGKRTPGTRLEICSPERLLEEMPGYALLLTWNFADEILAQQEEYRRRGGKFIIPLPTVRIV
jgi:hypothetical protein